MLGKIRNARKYLPLAGRNSDVLNLLLYTEIGAYPGNCGGDTGFLHGDAQR